MTNLKLKPSLFTPCPNECLSNSSFELHAVSTSCKGRCFLMVPVFLQHNMLITYCCFNIKDRVCITWFWWDIKSLKLYYFEHLTKCMKFNSIVSNGMVLKGFNLIDWNFRMSGFYLFTSGLITFTLTVHCLAILP